MVTSRRPRDFLYRELEEQIEEYRESKRQLDRDVEANKKRREEAKKMKAERDLLEAQGITEPNATKPIKG